MKQAKPKAIKWIAILILITGIRASMLVSLPTLEMFGGINPDAWLAPWITDSLLGLLAPLIAYLAYKKVGMKIWGLLVAYNCLGAYDYANGLLTQWMNPQIEIPEIGVFVFIGFFLLLQSFIVFLLFKKNIINHYSKK